MLEGLNQQQAFLMELLGKDGGEDAEQGAGDAEPQIDKAEELRQKWATELGQLWQIGEHRLLIGDCTDAGNVARLMGGEKAEMGFTSPPYLDMRDYSGNDLTLETLLLFIDRMIPVTNFQVVNLGLKFSDGAVVRYWDEYIKRFDNLGQIMVAWNVWDKMQGGSVASATNMFMLTHEWIFVFGKERKRLNRTVPNQLDKYERRHGKDFLSGTTRSVRQQSGEMLETTSDTYTHHQIHSVIQQTPELGPIRAEHPATFPVGLPQSYIEAMTDKGQLVYEPFCGSGTTMVAAQNTGRKCYGMEISPAYGAVILERMITAFPDIDIYQVE
jgi:DNA modification methylase